MAGRVGTDAHGQAARHAALMESRRRAAERQQCIEGRFCQAVVPSLGKPCGGELRYARRVEGDLIVSYLYCLLCGHLTRMLEVDLTTGKDRSVR